MKEILPVRIKYILHENHTDQQSGLMDAPKHHKFYYYKLLCI